MSTVPTSSIGTPDPEAVARWYANMIYTRVMREPEDGNSCSDVESALAEAMPDEELAALIDEPKEIAWQEYERGDFVFLDDILDSPCAPPAYDLDDPIAAVLDGYDADIDLGSFERIAS